MTLSQFNIREIQPSDNPKIAKTIREILIEFGVPKIGSAYEDKELDTLSEAFNLEKAVYFILEKNGFVVGGAGIRKLDNYNGNVCELQKMYFLSEARGLGLGNRMVDLCLKKAKEFGYKQCYLETMPYMINARKLYKKFGFSYMKDRMGDTGHFSCNLFMIKDLS
jgi:putative acetyltransferase